MELSVDEWEKMSNREAVLRREIFELEQTKKTMTEMLRKLEEEKRLLVAEKEQLATENAEVRCDRNLVLVTYCSLFSRKIKFHLVFSSLNRIFELALLDTLAQKFPNKF
jgi:hypothetical protein